VLWTIRLSALLYAGALVAHWRHHRSARALSIAGYALYLAHVYLAFDQRYAWSHAVAYAETARQTRELFGLDWGGGIYFNYAFTLLWPLDFVYPRNRWLHAFLIFMFVNGVFVFGKWWR
jgi:hypothetical protein